MSRKTVERNIREIYRRIREQSPPHHFEFSDPFWVLITTMLSHRTKDEVTDAAARSLYNRYRDSRGLSTASYEDVKALISRVGFSTVKAARVVEVARIIEEKYGGKVPGDIEKLTELPGVGRKTANVVLADSFGIPAIAVDTHVQRIATRLGITRSNDPEETEHILEKIVPRELWLGFNPTLVEFGKHVCRPIGPRCDICKISEFCDYYSKRKKS
ncbi:MAG: endonuclease III [Candidatus Thermoplasmatota archaeon]|jgi:endonuclease-3|nr:endonuclease III [Candidatus Thermoplasmatota archaeon]